MFFTQTLTVFKKNLTNYSRQVALWFNFYVPLLCGILSALGLTEKLRFLTLLWPIYQTLALNGLMRVSVNQIITERNDRQRETQKIMGLKQSSYFSGWFTTLYFLGLLSSLLYLLPIMIGQVYSANDSKLTIFDVLLSYFLYMIAATNQMLLLSSLFSDAKLASDVLGVLNLVFSLLWLFIFNSKVQSSVFFQSLLCMVPQSALNFTWFSKKWFLNYPFEFTFQKGIYSLVFDAFGYAIIYLYLDQVLPNEYGTQKSPWFIFTFWKKNQVYEQLQEEGGNQGQVELQQQENNNQLLNQEQSGQALYEEQDDSDSKKTKVIKMTQVIKEFSGFKAVNNLSLDLYENEIFCLLGHNGAGKTTTINLLTGMQNKSSGKIYINQLDLDDGIDQIRQSTGICSQKDVLYSELTVEEHLIYYGNLKNQNTQELHNQINQVISDCMLTLERFKKAKELSGGNKRKLSLAMALIGNAKTIFLDEPTSGLDPVSRQQLWAILKKVQVGRCIILTTHHLDEAEELAQKVGILCEGSMLALGSVEYIKRKFGVGYLLNIDYYKPVPKETHSILIKLLKGRDKNVKEKISENLPVQVIAILPFEQSKDFDILFNTIEELVGQYAKINLEMNSLEDAFINIGLDQNAFMQRINRGEDSTQRNIQIDQDEIDQNKFKIVPSYNFYLQFKSSLYRKWKLNITNPHNYFSLLSAWLLLWLGAYLGYQLATEYMRKPNDQQNIKVIYFEIFLSFSFSLITSNFVVIPVQEKEKGIKHQLYSLGLKQTSYWIGTFAFDMRIQTLNSLLILGIVIYYDIGELDNMWYESLALFLSFGAAINSYCYFLSLNFKQSSSAFISTPIITLLLYFLGGVILLGQVIRGAPYNILHDILTIMIMTAFPYINLILGMGKVQFIQDKETNSGLLVIDSGLWLQIVCCLAHSFLLLAFVIIYERSEYKKFIQSGQLQDNQAIRADQLHKTYNALSALKGISFDVKKSEIYGLLGPNGAGKSTTFNILTRKIKPNNGTVSIDEEESQVGIIPQFSPLYERIDVVSHLMIYGQMKGLDGQELKSHVEYFVNLLKLPKNRQVNVLSGGERRKLQLAICLIGGSTRLMMDEPSSGLDPIGKKLMQKVIKASVAQKGRSVVLTTHSMPEAQQLCDRIGILVNGVFQCQGTLQELREQFGNNYRVSLQVVKGKKNEAEQTFLKELWNQLLQRLEDKRELYLTYQISREKLSLGTLFGVLENKLKNEMKLIQEYSVYQISLEQIFTYYAQFNQYNQLDGEFNVQNGDQNSWSQVCNCQGTNCLRICTGCCCCLVW